MFSLYLFMLFNANIQIICVIYQQNMKLVRLENAL